MGFHGVSPRRERDLVTDQLQRCSGDPARRTPAVYSPGLTRPAGRLVHEDVWAPGGREGKLLPPGPLPPDTWWTPPSLPPWASAVVPALPLAGEGLGLRWGRTVGEAGEGRALWGRASALGTWRPASGQFPSVGSWKRGLARTQEIVFVWFYFVLFLVSVFGWGNSSF